MTHIVSGVLKRASVLALVSLACQPDSDSKPGSSTLERAAASEQPAQPQSQPAVSLAETLSGVLPAAADDRTIDAFFDQGSWIGWGNPDPKRPGAIVGPYDLRSTTWIGPSILEIERVNSALKPSSVTATFEEGVVTQVVTYEDATLETSFFFDEEQRTRVEFRIQGTEASLGSEGDSPSFSYRYKGEAFEGARLTQPKPGIIEIRRPRRSTPIRVEFASDSHLIKFKIKDNTYISEAHTIGLGPDFGIGSNVRVEQGPGAPATEPGSGGAAENRARERWLSYLNAWPSKSDDDAKLVHLAIRTLISNWRSPDGPIKHHGLFPSYAYLGFHGFWAWDSWKHAVALAQIDVELAKEQVRVMLNRQDERGMVPDVIYPGPTEEDNWRDTKPPLAAWAVEEIYSATDDIGFVKEILPRLDAYHQWWYRDRDHDQNGLCEYGSTDGTLIAAAWESGMDNAVRFDHAKMVQNNDAGWSMDRESVDLNAYLAVEKRILSRLYEATGEADRSKRYADDAKVLGQKINQRFWDEERGWYRDRLTNGTFADGWGPEGWIPLWAGLASKEQATRVRDTMLNPKKFGTKVPLGTLAADEPKFAPTRGYWRGPVWLDQAYFGLAGLRRYGFEAEADELTKRLLDNAEGLREGKAIRENYHPITGEGLNARHFSWSAASVLFMIAKLPAPV